jgi:pyruvate/2-oxoglutarate dehydrogenase complex dihydrolipoamide acyltransferase (E2) component
MKRVDAKRQAKVAVKAPMQGTVVAVEVSVGAAVVTGEPLLVLSAMKMEHVVEAPSAGTVRELLVRLDETVAAGQTLVVLHPADVAVATAEEAREIDPAEVRADLAEVQRRHARSLDAARPDAVARRRKTGQRTARENVAELCDPGTFVEYGGLVIAAQRQRRSLEDLIERTPADGLVAGTGHVNGDLFDESRTRCAVLAYDYTVLAGTQG